MKSNIFLRCYCCGKKSITKEYNISESEINNMMKLGQIALKLPQHIMCPQCHKLLCIELIKEEVK